jgi:hypothetical protein
MKQNKQQAFLLDIVVPCQFTKISLSKDDTEKEIVVCDGGRDYSLIPTKEPFWTVL